VCARGFLCCSLFQYYNSAAERYSVWPCAVGFLTIVWRLNMGSGSSVLQFVAVQYRNNAAVRYSVWPCAQQCAVGFLPVSWKLNMDRWAQCSTLLQ